MGQKSPKLLPKQPQQMKTSHQMPQRKPGSSVGIKAPVIKENNS